MDKLYTLHDRGRALLLATHLSYFSSMDQGPSNKQQDKKTKGNNRAKTASGAQHSFLAPAFEILAHRTK